MSAKFLNAGTAIFAALFAVAVLGWDQNATYDDLSDDLVSPWCRIGSPESWEGRPCVVPLDRVGRRNDGSPLEQTWRL